MTGIRFDQVNIVVADASASVAFLKQLGVGFEDTEPDWSAHHRPVPTASADFAADLDSPQFARYWGGLPDGFTGVVMNFRVDDRADVDELFERSLSLGAEQLRPPYDAFWGARYAVVEVPGPLYIGLMSRSAASHRTAPPEATDFI